MSWMYAIICFPWLSIEESQDEIKLIGNLSKVVTERFALLTAGRDTAQQLAASRIHYRRHKIHDSSRASWHIASYV
jgi:hypothetical protein